MNPPCASTPVQLHRGFTLVEIMIAVVILGILITIAVPTYRHFQRKAENTTFINNLRIFTQSFETYAMKTGAWPTSYGPGIVPTEMSGELREADWTSGALGGQWKWDGWPSHGSKPSIQPWGSISAAISIVGVNVDSTQMDEIDAIINAGSTSSSRNFQKSADSPPTYTYIVQK
jgi:prepilin-type N-terminal cleavage/methylation domain-containing protein